MGHVFQAVGWNRQKKIYDYTLGAAVVVYLGGFVGAGIFLFPNATIETLLIRALGSLAFLLLHVVLIIGPLHRLFPKTAPLLYNRRHLGVTMFLLATAHAAVSTVQFHTLGVLNPLVSILSDGGGGTGTGVVPFQLLGFLALLILFVMAATSHDFWLSRLSPATWKRLHFGVYPAYVLLVAHVSFGIGHQPGSGVWLPLTLAGVILVGGMHASAAVKTRFPGSTDTGWIRVGPALSIPNQGARTVLAQGDQVAVFRDGRRVMAVSGVCRHQGGPLGEGRIVNGCIVCPWHGFQYDPATGRAPAPFTECLPTFDVRLMDDTIYVSETPNPPGTPGAHVELGDGLPGDHLKLGQAGQEAE